MRDGTRTWCASVLMGLVVGVAVLVLAPGAVAATISLGGAGSYSYARDISPAGGADAADGDILDADTLNLDPLGTIGDESYSWSGVQYYVAGSSYFYRPNPHNQVGTIVFHFQADEGYLIETANVTSRMLIFDSGATLTIDGFWSTDNASWNSFAGVVAGGSDYSSVALSGLTPNRDLYLKYELFSSSPSVQSYVRLFLSNSGDTTDGFVVEGTIAKDPYTISLGGAGSYSYARDISPAGGADAADGDILDADTLNLDPLGTMVDQSYSRSGVQYYVAGSSYFYRPESYNQTGTIVFHFQADEGYLIETANVTSRMLIFDSGATLTIDGFWSTDNASWNSFAGVVAGGSDYSSVALSGLTPNRDLYLKYELFSSSPSVQSYVRLFLSNSGDTTDGLVVAGTIKAVPSGTLIIVQ